MFPFQVILIVTNYLLYFWFILKMVHFTAIPVYCEYLQLLLLLLFDIWKQKIPPWNRIALLGNTCLQFSFPCDDEIIEISVCQ